MTQRHTMYDVTTIGNYTKDTIVTAAGTRHADGGGFNYSARAAAGLGYEVAAITRLSADDAHVVAGLAEAGVDVFPTFTPDSTLMRLEYPTDDVDQRILSVAATAGSFTSEQLASVDSKAYVITASFRGEVSSTVVRDLWKTDATIGLDAQGFIRIRRPDTRLEHCEWPERDEVLACVDILKADAVEAEALTGISDILEAAKALAALGPREIVVTHSGGVLILAEGTVHEATFHPRQLVGRSGRGDTCLGSYVATRLTMPPAEATVWAAATTSLKMEGHGPFDRGVDDVVELIEKEYGGTAERPLSVAKETTPLGLVASERNRRV